MAPSIQIQPLWLFPKIMVIRESRKLICKPLTQISSLGGMERRGQNSPSIPMEEVTFFFMLVCVSYTEVHQNSVAETDTSLGSALALLSWASCEATKRFRELPDTAESQQREERERLRKRELLSHFHPLPGSWALPCRWSLLSVLCRRTELTESRLS